MVKDYICKKEKISHAIDEVSNFMHMMEKFNSKYDNKYSYAINIKELKNETNKWVIKIKMTKNEG